LMGGACCSCARPLLKLKRLLCFLRCWAHSLKDGAFLACEPGATDDEAGGGNVVKELPSSETVLAFLRRVMTHPRLMNTSKAGEKRAPARPTAMRFADTATAALHVGDKDKWAGETACPYVEGCRAGLAALGGAVHV
jgi:hypothetical protein